MKRVLICLSVFLAVGCSTDDRFKRHENGPGAGNGGAPALEDAATPEGVCELSKCARPEVGLACCTPLAQCGSDPSGLGLSCVANSGGAASAQVCDLNECPEPTVGIACCTPFAQCGFDPFSSGLWCFANPPDVTMEGVDAAVCDLSKCSTTDGGPAACCLPNGECGLDSWGIGVCFAAPAEPVAPVDAAVPPYDSVKPDDPSVTPACESYIGPAGPIWGCCTAFGVCGTFQQGACLLPPGTIIPAQSPDEDAGTPEFPFCTPPTAD